MLDDRDHYEAYYADKLWNLIPAIYRAQDTDQFDNTGPLARTGQSDWRASRDPASQHRSSLGGSVDRDLRRLGDSLYR